MSKPPVSPYGPEASGVDLPPSSGAKQRASCAQMGLFYQFSRCERGPGRLFDIAWNGSEVLASPVTPCPYALRLAQFFETHLQLFGQEFAALFLCPEGLLKPRSNYGCKTAARR